MDEQQLQQQQQHQQVCTTENAIADNYCGEAGVAAATAVDDSREPMQVDELLLGELHSLHDRLVSEADRLLLLLEPRCPERLGAKSFQLHRSASTTSTTTGSRLALRLPKQLSVLSSPLPSPRQQQQQQLLQAAPSSVQSSGAARSVPSYGFCSSNSLTGNTGRGLVSPTMRVTSKVACFHDAANAYEAAPNLHATTSTTTTTGASSAEDANLLEGESDFTSNRGDQDQERNFSHNSSNNNNSNHNNNNTNSSSSSSSSSKLGAERPLATAPASQPRHLAVAAAAARGRKLMEQSQQQKLGASPSFSIGLSGSRIDSPRESRDVDVDLESGNFDLQAKNSIYSPRLHSKETGISGGSFDPLTTNTGSTQASLQNSSLFGETGSIEGRQRPILHPSVSSFLDHEDMAMKEKATRASMLSHYRSQSKAANEQSRMTLRGMVTSHAFEAIVAVAVLLNALLIGIDVQISSEHPGKDTPIYFYIVQHVFTIFFVIELCLRVKAFGPRELFVRHGLSWDWFDLFIVISAVCEMLSDILYFTGNSDDALFIDISQLRMARVAKVTRLIKTFRIQRIIRIVAPLRTLVFSIAVTLKSLMWAMCLLAIIIYIVSVVIVQTATSIRADPGDVTSKEVQKLEDFFVGLPTAMWTLLQSISGGLNWREPGVALLDVAPWMSVVFTFFVCFVYFAVLNVVTGIFCNSAIETAQRTPEVIATEMISTKNDYERNLRQLFAKMDKEGSGLLTLNDLQKVFRDEVMHAQLAALEINVQDAWSLFRLLDRGKSGQIGINEFVEGCISLKGAAKGVDVANLRNELRLMSRYLHKMTYQPQMQQMDTMSLGGAFTVKEL